MSESDMDPRYAIQKRPTQTENDKQKGRIDCWGMCVAPQRVRLQRRDRIRHGPRIGDFQVHGSKPRSCGAGHPRAVARVQSKPVADGRAGFQLEHNAPHTAMRAKALVFVHRHLHFDWATFSESAFRSVRSTFSRSSQPSDLCAARRADARQSTLVFVHCDITVLYVLLSWFLGWDSPVLENKIQQQIDTPIDTDARIRTHTHTLRLVVLIFRLRFPRIRTTKISYKQTHTQTQTHAYAHTHTLRQRHVALRQQ